VGYGAQNGRVIREGRGGKGESERDSCVCIGGGWRGRESNGEGRLDGSLAGAIAVVGKGGRP
jgi:hypothetical protein